MKFIPALVEGKAVKMNLCLLFQLELVLIRDLKNKKAQVLLPTLFIYLQKLLLNNFFQDSVFV